MQDIVYLYDAAGALCGVQLSPALWQRARAHVLELLPPQTAVEAPEPLDAWEDFKRYWDFKYPFRADVECAHCGVRCEDWEHDPARRFLLRNASLGGLLVFRCTACGADIRKKHFKDHVVFEMTPPRESSITRSGAPACAAPLPWPG